MVAILTEVNNWLTLRWKADDNVSLVLMTITEKSGVIERSRICRFHESISLGDIYHDSTRFKSRARTTSPSGKLRGFEPVTNEFLVRRSHHSRAANVAIPGYFSTDDP